MFQTTLFNLNKPEKTDYFDVKHQNENMDKIEKALIDLEAKMMDKAYPMYSYFITEDTRNPKEILGIGVWEQLQNAFLWGTNNAKNVGSVGGTTGTQTLSSKNMPKHSHNFSGYCEDKNGHTHDTSHRHYVTMNIDHKHYLSGVVPMSGKISWIAGANPSGNTHYFATTAANTITTTPTTSINTIGSPSITAVGANTDYAAGCTKEYVNINIPSQATTEAGAGEAFSIMPPYRNVFIWRRVG